MTKTELLEKVSERAGIRKEEQKSFFEILLIRIAEILQKEESVYISDLGRFEYKKSVNENDLLFFISTNGEELLFDIPEKEQPASIEPVDSYFSISIGKPVISFKGSGEKEHFIPQSGNDIKRILELKAEKFLDDSSIIEIEHTNNLEDITFSFLNWKKSTDVNEEINNIEKDIDDSINEETKKEIDNKDLEHETLVESKYVPEEEIEKTEDEIKGEFLIEDSEIEDNIENIDEDLNEIEDSSKTGDELISDTPDDKDELIESSEAWVDEIIEETNAAEEKIPEEVSSELRSPFSEDSNEDFEDDDPGVKDAFRYAEERKARLDSYKKRSYGGIIFSAVILLITAGVIYFSYYYTEREDITSSMKISQPKKFNVVVERSFDIPVSYPYQMGMFGSYYNAIDDDLLKPVVAEEPGTESETSLVNNETSKVPEIRDPLPAARIKGYIYKYNDGTFAAQVSSWKSKSIALSETQKYLDAGYNSFIEQTELAGKTYYRVRIGGFKSLADAESFLNK